MKKFLRILVIIILFVGVGFVYIVKNPSATVSQKILTTLGISTMIQQPVQQSTGIVDLTNCISYFDGCNNCSVKDGKVEACTLMYCETPGEPKCNEYSTGVENTGNVGLANPASVNCKDKGGTLNIVTSSDGGQVGMCTLTNGTVCEERAYMRGECGTSTTTGEAGVSPGNPGSTKGSEGTVCTMEYTPVCATVAVQCIKAPCPPITQTFSNKCVMNTNKLATFLHDGECTGR